MEYIENTNDIMRRISDLLIMEQGKYGLTNFQMSQRLDVPLRTYNGLISGKAKFCTFVTLDKILKNSSITYDDVFEGIYKSKYSKKEI